MDGGEHFSYSQLLGRIRELEEMNQAMHPDNAPKDSWPVVLYFKTAEDRSDFIKAAEALNPGLRPTAAAYRKPTP